MLDRDPDTGSVPILRYYHDTFAYRDSPTLLVNLASGYYGIELEKELKKTAFIVDDKWNRLAFGLTNAPGRFQRPMNSVL
ncbi:hypothetical protein OUZ56_021667 [Daphnia magna]|uniref:Uncharacterized protein n=1 Tax=Daphnia magna TaxID=35525 RepID=A0ABR0AU67_9CRUS|nr:hypothetical protein OUZ56_021667 [Daphnia magna]